MLTPWRVLFKTNFHRLHQQITRTVLDSIKNYFREEQNSGSSILPLLRGLQVPCLASDFLRAELGLFIYKPYLNPATNCFALTNQAAFVRDRCIPARFIRCVLQNDVITLAGRIQVKS